MQSVEIRSVDHSDFELWLPLWRNYQRFYEVDIPDAVTLKTWARFLDPNEPMHAVLAMSNGQALGLAHTIYQRSCWVMGEYCYLEDLFVVNQARGSGVGRALIEHVHTEAKARGASRVHWLTHETNHDAMQLYDRLAIRSGFVQYRKFST